MYKPKLHNSMLDIHLLHPEEHIRILEILKDNKFNNNYNCS